MPKGMRRAERTACVAKVLLEADKNRLTVYPNQFEEGTVIMGLPSRRWLPTKGVFQVPLTKINARMLLEAVSSGAFVIDAPIVEDVLTKLAYPAIPHREWNGDYRVQPFPDQHAACEKLFNYDTGAMFMRPGSGKSFVGVNLASKHFDNGTIDCMVVVCPLTVTTVWTSTPDGQVAMYSPVPCHVNQWSEKLRRPTMPGLEWVVVGIESLSQGGTFGKVMSYLAGRKYGVMVDESTRIKNIRAIRTQRVIELGECAVFRIIATGTPASNDLLDLYSQFQFLDPNIIGVGDYYAFRNRYCKMGGYKNKEVVGYENVDELMGLIEPYTYRCDKPRDLPPKLFTQRTVVLAPEQKDTYNKVKAAGFEGISVANILNRVEKLQQVVGGYLREDPKVTIDPLSGRQKKVQGKIIWELPDAKNPKMQALLEFVEEMGRDRQLVVWARHLWEIEKVAGVLTPLGGTITLTGADEIEDRRSKIREFQAGNTRFFVGNAATGGIGITLHAAHHCAFYSNTFSYEDRVQAEDRLHRIGQKNDVLYVDLVMDKTVDILIQRALKEKLDLDAYLARALDTTSEARIMEIL